ncbi:MAG: polysaccharide biosynthesis protein, partial [Clostridia bacterium]|nr:polysaccharide biosynthesis protein [Clostridia bacterium]
RLSGYEPDIDIMVEYTGLRPGEKLYEELLMKTETLDMTENKMIFIERDTPLTREQVDEKLAVLKQAVEESKCEIGSAKVKEAVKSVVPTFREPNEINKDAASSNEMKEAKVN